MQRRANIKKYSTVFYFILCYGISWSGVKATDRGSFPSFTDRPGNVLHKYLDIFYSTMDLNGIWLRLRSMQSSPSRYRAPTTRLPFC